MKIKSKVFGLTATALGLAFSAQAVLAECDHHKDHHDVHLTEHHAHTPVAMVEPLSDESLHHLPAVWRDHRNEPLTLSDLSGQAVIITMVYVGCQTACPVLVEDVKRLYYGLNEAEQANTRVLVVSFDAKGDTPEVLNTFAQNLGGDLPGWHFVTGAEGDIRTFSSLLGIRYRQNPSGGFDHSNVIAVLDRQGEIRGRQEGLAQAPDRLLGALRGALN
ncbi:SCO family protein [Marinimicrobium sp. ABcell2]|uniref:SCO family protein n=1 Tax=Marinimicrobium sp. ABcell2 TaxID=3069751 RepID=UPI0027B2702D|nr:SCO family protein [Marinimicrobium sp. ABcell2]MDQ2076439.1 SCO family protein [Marinimicrobium sp. ABcell2]